jgi:hypothetical protein
MARSTSRRCALSGLIALAAVTVACQPADRQAAGDTSAAAMAGEAGAIQVVAREYALDAPDSVSSGWVTFRFENQGKEPHFFILHHAPDGITREDFLQAAAPFDSAMDLLRSGGTKEEAGKIVAEGLPAWFADVHEMGGAGLVSPGGSTEVTIKLVPGNYLMECYVKNGEGRFHTALGMLRQLIVTAAPSAAQPPEADLELSLSAAGIAGPDHLAPGQHTLAVHYEAQPEGLVGYDVHTVRLAEGQSVDDVVPWMNWMNVGGMKTPAPAEFVGGVQEMPTGYTAYFTLDLEPGSYAWISEVGADQGMVKAFTVE